MCEAVLFSVSLPGPSAAPVDLSFIASTSSSITIQWGTVPCIHHNGNITGYLIGWKKDDEIDFVYKHAKLNGEQREAEIPGLEPSTQY